MYEKDSVHYLLSFGETVIFRLPLRTTINTVQKNACNKTTKRSSSDKKATVNPLSCIVSLSLVLNGKRHVAVLIDLPSPVPKSEGNSVVNIATSFLTLHHFGFFQNQM